MAALLTALVLSGVLLLYSDVMTVPPGVEAALGRGLDTSAPAGPTTPPAGRGTPAPSAAPSGSSALGGTASPAPADTAIQSPVFRIPGPVPSAGTRTFAYAPGQGGLIGRGGQLRRYRVAVERGTGEDVQAFATAVDTTLADPGSWTASGQLRLRRVPDGAGHDFTVYLVTAQTARRMCLAGGVDITVGGSPYTSCRAPGKVIINLERWRRSVDHYVAAKVPLATYRDYVVNHEVGHELGHRHERCPGKGRPAPTMMQQTLFLNGCVANPWPYRDGRRYAGPPL